MSTEGKHSVLWSPTHEDKFLKFVNDLSLYKVEPIRETSKGEAIKLCDEFQGTLLASNADHSYIKCVAWCPKSPPENLLAVGLATGKVVFTSFGKASSEIGSLVGKELIPKHGRTCNYLAWNPVETNLLAQGLDKYRQDNSIQIWDLTQKSDGSLHSKAAFEIGHSEETSSLAWFRSTAKSLVTGINNKFLRIYDLRDIKRPRSVAYTKAVYGVEVDPHNDNRIASYMEGQVCVWDTRHFDKPVITLPQSKPLMKLSWSKTRSNLLSCLPKDSPVIKLYDIQYTHGSSEDLEPAVVERIIKPYKQSSTICGFDWHPTHENKLLTVATNGSVRQLKIYEKISVVWSPDIYLSWGCGRQLQQVHSVKLCREASEDISLKMKRRALKGYGLQREIVKNGLITDDPQLKNIWNWLSYAKSILLEEQQQIQQQQQQQQHKNQKQQPTTSIRNQVQGIRSILKYDVPPQTPKSSNDPMVTTITTNNTNGSSSRSNMDFLSWQLLDGHRLRSQRKVYRSEERLRALLYCGWGAEMDGAATKYIENLESQQEFEKAAAIAVFTLRLGQAITVLQNGARHQKDFNPELNLNVVAMALSGYYDDKNTLWKDMCGSLKSNLTNPYLRAMFSFLTCDEEKYSEILAEEDMAVVDRVAFACMYLPDIQLQEFVCTLCGNLIEKGNLDGILLTGLSLDCVDLLQHYIDRTGDIQTAALTAIQGVNQPELSRDRRVDTWIQTYRELLDVWRLWHERAEFDVFRNTMDVSLRIEPQVCACCNFCGKSIGYNSSSNRNRAAFMFTASGALRSRTVSFSAPMHNTAKITSCPGCRKPLPRCSLCLINMGTAAGNQRHKQTTNLKAITSEVEGSEKLTSFSDWFTWCQSCRHGGHANHLTQWFKDNKECPVTGCSCKCTALDNVANVLTDTPDDHS